MSYKFIKLTSVDNEPCLVNPWLITWVYPEIMVISGFETRTVVCWAPEGYVRVLEDFETVSRLIKEARV